mmetsp:Transcript_126574/g.269976  ORF Transcript_126574/g.269976 Transcript_126574/m.269976 type:complete len:387 (+) Transcript_126574:721-1881(+)
MNQPQGVHVVEGGEHLLRDFLKPPQSKVGLVAALAVKLRELVEIVAQQLGHDDEVLLVVEVIIQAQHAVLIDVAIHIDVLQQLDLIQGLVEEVLVVLDDLHADHLVVLQIKALNSSREGSRSKVLKNLIPRSDHCVHANGELLRLLEACLVPLENDAEAEGVVDDAIELDGIKGVPGRRIPCARLRRPPSAISPLPLLLRLCSARGLGQDRACVRSRSCGGSTLGLRHCDSPVAAKGGRGGPYLVGLPGRLGRRCASAAQRRSLEARRGNSLAAPLRLLNHAAVAAWPARGQRRGRKSARRPSTRLSWWCRGQAGCGELVCDWPRLLTTSGRGLHLVRELGQELNLIDLPDAVPRVVVVVVLIILVPFLLALPCTSRPPRLVERGR